MLFVHIYRKSLNASVLLLTFPLFRCLTKGPSKPQVETTLCTENRSPKPPRLTFSFLVFLSLSFLPSIHPSIHSFLFALHGESHLKWCNRMAEFAFRNCSLPRDVSILFCSSLCYTKCISSWFGPL